MIFVSSKPLTAPRPLPPHVLPPTPIHPTIPLLALLSVVSSHYEPVDPHVLPTSSPVILPSPAVAVSPATCSLTYWPGRIMSYLCSVLYFLGFPVCTLHFVSSYSYHLIYLVFRFSALRSVCASSCRTCVSSPCLPTGLTTCFPFTPCRYPQSICTSMSQFGNILTVRFDFLGTAICSVQSASLYSSLPVCVCKCILPCAFRLGTLHVTANLASPSCVSCPDVQRQF